ncbi:VOC family protein [Hymenobacter negativus]|uniref:VOC family protein n=1 Tax=Hymenobacter negativus TaxID=2795026 RepID=A0ABS3QKY9_9BACT|nr:VOC family protein [Hymenobacter negativus]MBO2011911.1 VOC family protein [Hymenobacter negativus]
MNERSFIFYTFVQLITDKGAGESSNFLSPTTAMQLKHLNLVVPDVPQAQAFFETFFDFHGEQNKNNMLTILRDPHDFVLVITRLTADDPANYPRWFHIGFIADTPEQVHAKYEQLHAGGVAIEAKPRVLHGSLVFYFYAFGYLLTEVSCPLPSPPIN